MAKGPTEYALAKASGIMLAGADFIERRAAKDGDGCCREVIVRLDETSFTNLVRAGLAERATPGAVARAFVLAGLGGALPPAKPEKKAANDHSHDLEESRRQLGEARAKLADALKALDLERAATHAAASDLKAARAAQRQAEDERDQWRDRESETQEDLQAIGEKFGVRGGEPRVAGISRVLDEQRSTVAALQADIAMLNSRLAGAEQRLVKAEAASLLAAEAAPTPPPAATAKPPLTKAFLKLVASYRWTDSTPRQIAAALNAPVDDVLRAIDINSWNKT